MCLSTGEVLLGLIMVVDRQQRRLDLIVLLGVRGGQLGVLGLSEVLRLVVHVHLDLDLRLATLYLELRVVCLIVSGTRLLHW